MTVHDLDFMPETMLSVWDYSRTELGEYHSFKLGNIVRVVCEKSDVRGRIIDIGATSLTLDMSKPCVAIQKEINYNDIVKIEEVYDDWKLQNM